MAETSSALASPIGWGTTFPAPRPAASLPTFPFAKFFLPGLSCLSFGPCHLSYSQVCPNVPPQSLTPVGQATRDALLLCTPGSPTFPLSLGPRSPCHLFRAPRSVRPTVFPAFRVGELFPPQAQASASESLSGDPQLGREGVSSLFERESAPLGQAQVRPTPRNCSLSPTDWGVRGVVCDKPTVLARPRVLVGGVARGWLPLPASWPGAHGPARPTPRHESARGPGSEQRLGGEGRRRPPRAAASVMGNGIGPRCPDAGWTPATTTALLFERVGGSEKSL